MGGLCNPKLRAYANGWYRGPRTPESFHEKAKDVIDRGYTALKFDPFGRIISEPLEGEGILMAECSEEKIFTAKAECDLAGHYSIWVNGN